MGVVEIVQVVNTSSFMNVIEKFYVREETQTNNHMNCRFTTRHNEIFETIVRHPVHGTGGGTAVSIVH
jgi:hypothetical protein